MRLKNFHYICNKKATVMDSNTLDFTIFCVANVADRLKMNARDVYHKLRQSGIINDYIIPCYDVLHTFSKQYITDDLVSLMKKKGLIS